MADKKTETQGRPNPEAQGMPDLMAEKVKIKLYKGPQNMSDVFVSVNGHRFQIQRGVEVEVPRYVAEVLATSTRQDEEALERREKMAAKIKGKK